MLKSAVKKEINNYEEILSVVRHEFTAISSIFAQKQYTLTSPDENLQTNVYVGEKLSTKFKIKKNFIGNSP
jgi:hypothetical protein